MLFFLLFFLWFGFGLFSFHMKGVYVSMCVFSGLDKNRKHVRYFVIFVIGKN